jgi:hypothetical protein
VTLAGTTSIIDTTNNGGTAAGAGITLGGAVDGTVANTQSLTLNAGTGGLNFNGALGTGGGNSLHNVSVTNAGATNFNSSVNITGALTQTNDATGTTTFANTVSVGSAVLKGADYSINNSFASAGATSISNTGTVTKGATGAITSTGTFNVTGNVNLANNISTTGTNLTIGGNLGIAEGVSLTLSTGAASGGNVSIGGTVDGTAGGGSEALTLQAGTGTVNVAGALGAVSALGTLSASGAGVSFGTVGGAAAGVTGNVTINSTGAVSLGASKVGVDVDIIGGGLVSQGNAWNIGRDLWVRTTSGNIALKSMNVLLGKVSLIASGAGAEVWFYASDAANVLSKIEVNTAEAPSGAGGLTGILGTTVILQADSGSAFKVSAGLAGGLVKATSSDTATPALTIKTTGSNGNVVTGAIGSNADLALRVETSGLVLVEGNGVSDGTINLKGDDKIQPKYEFSGNPLYRRVLYNGNDATNAQLTGALDAAYLDIRNATTEVRESGFAKENASKVLRRGVVTSAGPGQPAVDDSTGMAGSEECEGGFANGSLSCQ